MQRYHYGSHDQPRRHLADFLVAYNFAKSLKPRGDGEALLLQLVRRLSRVGERQTGPIAMAIRAAAAAWHYILGRAGRSDHIEKSVLVRSALNSAS